MNFQILRAYDSSKVKADPLLEDYPCEIIIQGTHNHKKDGPYPCSHLKILDETKQAFYNYFSEKLTPAQARHKHSMTLLENGVDLKLIQNTKYLPKQHQVCTLWSKWRDEEYGGNGWYQAIDNIELNYQSNDRIQISPDRDAVAIITPVMQRTHQLHSQSKEIVFMDTTSNTDNCHTSVTFLLTASSLGAMPLAVILSDAQDKSSYAAGLKLVRQMTDGYGFYGNGYPEIFMTDDSAAERGALQQEFPESTLLLCIFHFLQVIKMYTHRHSKYTLTYKHIGCTKFSIFINS